MIVYKSFLLTLVKSIIFFLITGNANQVLKILLLCQPTYFLLSNRFSKLNLKDGFTFWWCLDVVIGVQIIQNRLRVGITQIQAYGRVCFARILQLQQKSSKKSRKFFRSNILQLNYRIFQQFKFFFNICII